MNILDYYILRGRTLISVTKSEWREWWRKIDPNYCIIGELTLKDTLVQTYFVGLPWVNEQFMTRVQPKDFDTDDYPINSSAPLPVLTEWYTTYDDAVEGHNRWVDKVRREREVL